MSHESINLAPAKRSAYHRQDSSLYSPTSPENAFTAPAHSRQDPTDAGRDEPATELATLLKSPNVSAEERTQESKNARARKRSSIPVTELFRDFTVARALLLLVIANLILILINLLQILFLQDLPTLLPIVLPSAVVLFLVIAIVVGYVILHRSAVRRAWREASWGQTTSWIGAVFAILLPVILCQFLYFAAFAFREYRSWTFTTNVTYGSRIGHDFVPGLPPPALYIKQNTGNPVVTLGGDPSCDLYSSSATDSTDCDGDVIGIQFDDLHYDHLFNAGENNSINLQGQGYENYVEISSDVQWNSTRGGMAVVSYAIFDPRLLPLSGNTPDGIVDTDILNDCELVNWIVAPALANNYISVERVVIQDDERGLQELNFTKCGDFRNIAWYRATITSVPFRNPDYCDIGNNSNAPNCTMYTDMSYTSYLTTTFQSVKKKGKKEIILDESAIAGGVTFFTYFFSLFVL